jgi:protein arginine kinase
LAESGAAREIAISTRARLARNLAAFPFPHRATIVQRKRVAQLVREAAKIGDLTQLRPVDLAKLSESKRLELVATQRISPQMAKGTLGQWALLATDGSLSILINEEDHLRLQALAPGCEPERVYQEVNAMERLLARGLEFAQDERFGFLTTSLANVGTGLRLSVLLHLPALTWLKELAPQFEAVYALGGTVRGLHGEGTESTGALYQVSHERTYRPESDPLNLVRSVQGAAEVLIAAETDARIRLPQVLPYSLRTHWERATERITTAEQLPTTEALELLSYRRLAGLLGLSDPLGALDFAEALLTVGQGDSVRQQLTRASLLRNLRS